METALCLKDLIQHQSQRSVTFGVVIITINLYQGRGVEFMKKLISLFLGLIFLTGCTFSTSANEKTAVAYKGKNTYKSFSELKTEKLNGTDPWLKNKKTLYTIDENKNSLEIEKIEVGEYVTFVSYSSKDKNFVFTFGQQQFPNIKEAYKDTASRMENSYELTLNGNPLTIARGKEAVLVSMPLDDYLIKLVIPKDISDGEIFEILESIKKESL